MKRIKEGQDSMAGVGMGNYIVDEGPELTSTVRAITNDIGEPILQLYNTLRSMAKQFQESKGDLKGFQMIAAGASQRWYDNFYFNRLGKELRHLTQQSPRYAGELHAFLSTLPKNFAELSAKLPEILLQIGQKSKNEELSRKAQVWINARNSYRNYLKELESSGDDEYDEPVKSPKNPALGQQAGQADSIVNDILRKLPSKVAGDIRNAIARSPNKLQALQSELQKRGIKVPMSEGLSKDYFVNSARPEFNTKEITLSELLPYLMSHGRLHRDLNTNENYFPQNLYSGIRRRVVKESSEQTEITPFINRLQSIDYKGEIKVGDMFSVLNTDINFSGKEIIIFGFINPKEISKISLNPNGKINYIMFSDGDRYPRQVPATYKGSLVVFSSYFNSAQSASKALTMLSLSVPDQWIYEIDDPLKSAISESHSIIHKKADLKQVPINESAEIAIRILINQLAKK